MATPTGEQFACAAGDYRCVVTESGAALRLLTAADRPLIDGFDADELPAGGRGQLLMPWPNRIADGRYSFGGSDHQLALTEVARHNASHGLVRWAAWTLEEHTARSISLTYRLMAQTGYPWTLDLRTTYDLTADGLTVTQSATNLADSPAPYAAGAHPYLTVALSLAEARTEGQIDDWELTLPANRRVVVDDRLLPIDTSSVDGTSHDFRMARPLRGVGLDDAFTDLIRDDRGGIEVTISGDGGRTVLWGDDTVRWLQLFTADGVPGRSRRSLAVEPMTAPAGAFVSGDGLVVLEPSGSDGSAHTMTWGIRAG